MEKLCNDNCLQVATDWSTLQHTPAPSFPVHLQPSHQRHLFPAACRPRLFVQSSVICLTPAELLGVFGNLFVSLFLVLCPSLLHPYSANLPGNQCVLLSGDIICLFSLHQSACWSSCICFGSTCSTALFNKFPFNFLHSFSFLSFWIQFYIILMVTNNPGCAWGSCSAHPV